MLYNTNITAVVGKNEESRFTPWRLVFWDTISLCVRKEIVYNSDILFVKMNTNHLVVSVTDHLEVFDIQKMQSLYSLDLPNSLSKVFS
jgi:hypothetical protein